MIFDKIIKENEKDFDNMLDKLIAKYGEDKIRKMSPIQIVNLIMNENGEQNER